MPVDEDGDVFAQRRLVVKHVAARLRILGKDFFQHLRHGAAVGFAFGTRDMALKVLPKDDLGHFETTSVFHSPSSFPLHRRVRDASVQWASSRPLSSKTWPFQ